MMGRALRSGFLNMATWHRERHGGVARQHVFQQGCFPSAGGISQEDSGVLIKKCPVQEIQEGRLQGFPQPRPGQLWEPFQSRVHQRPNESSATCNIARRKCEHTGLTVSEHRPTPHCPTTGTDQPRDGLKANRFRHRFFQVVLPFYCDQPCCYFATFDMNLLAHCRFQADILHVASRKACKSCWL